MVSGETAIGLGDSLTGDVLKQSEWLKRWNSRRMTVHFSTKPGEPGWLEWRGGRTPGKLIIGSDATFCVVSSGKSAPGATNQDDELLIVNTARRR